MNPTNKMLRDMIYQTKGKVFSVWFHKKDGSVRHMNCRIGVHKGLKDGFQLDKLPSLSEQLDRVTVYDMKMKGYRSFYLDSVFRIAINGFWLSNFREHYDSGL